VLLLAEQAAAPGVGLNKYELVSPEQTFVSRLIACFMKNLLWRTGEMRHSAGGTADKSREFSERCTGKWRRTIAAAVTLAKRWILENAAAIAATVCS
jgi:hypothetical protein